MADYNEFYSVTRKDEIVELARETTILQERVVQARPQLEQADKDIANLIQKTGKEVVTAKDEDTRKALFDELTQLNNIGVAIRSQLGTIEYVSQALKRQQESLMRMGRRRPQNQAGLQGVLRTFIEHTLGSVIVARSFADTISPPAEKGTRTLASGNGADAVPGWLRILAQIIVTAVVSLFLATLGIWSTRFIFSPAPAGASNEQLKTHEDSKKFAQDVVKTLLSFSLGIMTGLVAVK